MGRLGVQTGRLLQGYTPHKSVTETPLKIEPNADFILMHYPMTGWRMENVAGQLKLVPVLKPLHMIGGCAGVKTRDKRIVATQAISIREGRGWIILRNQDEYRLSHEVKGGVVHYLKWTKLVDYGGGNAELEFDAEAQKAYAEWRLQLVYDGVIPPPTARTLRRLEAKHKKRISFAMKDDTRHPKTQRRLEQSEKELAALQRASDDAPETRDKDAEIADLRAQLAALEGAKVQPKEEPSAEPQRRRRRLRAADPGGEQGPEKAGDAEPAPGSPPDADSGGEAGEAPSSA